MRVYTILCLALACATVSAADVRLAIGVSPDNHVKLMWPPSQWNPEWRGFTISRGLADDPKSQQSLTPTPIVPDFREASLRERGLDEVLAQKAKFEVENPHPDMLLDSYANDREAYLRISRFSRKSQNFQWARAFGFGYLDTTVTAGETYTYVLRPVDADGNAGEPLATATITASYGAFRLPPGSILEVKRRSELDATPSLSVAVPTTILEQQAILYVKFLQASDLGQPLTETIGQSPMPMFAPDGDMLRSSGSGRKPVEGAAKFAIAPVDIFGTVGKISTRTVLPALRNQGEAPTNVQARVFGARAMVTWEAEGYGPEIAGFHVVRRGYTSNSGTKKITSQPLPATARTFVDSTIDDMAGQAVQYRIIRASTENIHSCPSSEAARVDLREKQAEDEGAAPSPPPSFAVSEVSLLDDGQVQVACRWSASLSQDVDWYEIRSPDDPDALARVPAEKLQALLTLEVPADDLILHAVAGRGEQVSRGSDRAIIAPATLRPPPAPTTVTTEQIGDRLRITWHMPTIAGVDGYRLTIDGIEVADATSVGAIQCIYDWWGEATANTQVTVQAVGPGGTSATAQK